MFDSQNNYKNQILSIIVYHKIKPILEFDYFLWRKSKYVILESNSIFRCPNTPAATRWIGQVALVTFPCPSQHQIQVRIHFSGDTSTGANTWCTGLVISGPVPIFVHLCQASCLIQVAALEAVPSLLPFPASSSLNCSPSLPFVTTTTQQPPSHMASSLLSHKQHNLLHRTCALLLSMKSITTNDDIACCSHLSLYPVSCKLSWLWLVMWLLHPCPFIIPSRFQLGLQLPTLCQSLSPHPLTSHLHIFK